MIKRSNHKKRNPLRHAWRRSQGKSNKPFTPLIEVQTEAQQDKQERKETYVV